MTFQNNQKKHLRVVFWFFFKRFFWRVFRAGFLMPTLLPVLPTPVRDSLSSPGSSLFMTVLVWIINWSVLPTLPVTFSSTILSDRFVHIRSRMFPSPGKKVHHLHQASLQACRNWCSLACQRPLSPVYTGQVEVTHSFTGFACLP
jgi:hypothetical protein